MSDPVQSAIVALRVAREHHEAVVVSYSGGKDSLVVMDLCVKTFSRVSAFYMAFLPGLWHTHEVKLRFAERWPNVELREYPHWVTSRCLKGAVYCDPARATDQLPSLSVQDIYRAVRAETGMSLIAFGGKRSDGVWRQLDATLRRDPLLIAPLAEWRQMDVVAYCTRHDLPAPPSTDGRSSTGLDLSARSLQWLQRAYPCDFDAICEVFPYAEAAIYRAQFYPN